MARHLKTRHWLGKPELVGVSRRWERDGAAAERSLEERGVLLPLAEAPPVLTKGRCMATPNGA